MQSLTEHEKKILEMVKHHPEIVGDRKAREKVATEFGITEKTLRNRIADLKRYGMIGGKSTILSQPITNLADKEFYNQMTIDENTFEYNINLLDYIEVLIKRRKFIIRTSFVIGLVSIIVSLLLPKWYKAIAVIMPPGGDKEFSLGTIAADLPFGGFGIVGGSEESNIYLAILKSMTMAKSVINKFDLMKKYKAENVEQTIEKLQENVWFAIDDEGTISIHFLDKDQQLVADVANYYMTELDQINKRLASERARNNRVFIEGRVEKTKNELRVAEDRLRLYQEKYGLIAIETQTEEAVRTAAEMRAQIMSTEVNLAVMEQSVNKNNPKLSVLRFQLSELQDKYNSLKFNNNKIYEQDIFHPLFDVPELGLRYARLYSEVKMLSTVLEYLLPEYEQAKIQEARDTPTVQILDKAVPPEEKYKPQRTIIVVLSTFIGFTFSILGAFILHYVDQLKQRGGETLKKYNLIIADLKSDLPFRSKKR